jgi:broad specificity phosphatase PhoE
LTELYLIRHAQAGTRDNYDELSEVGRRQARLLGDYLFSQGLSFGAVHSGGMLRQRLSAEIACAPFDAKPELITDERWNEFSLAGLYRAFARRMSEESPAFASDLREMQEALRVDPHTTRGATGRCDAAIVKAWMENRYPDYEGESWNSFRARVHSCALELLDGEVADRVAVFTSATPIAVLAAGALGLTDDRLISVLGVLYNSGMTILRSRSSELRLFTLNAIPHLPADLVTFR